MCANTTTGSSTKMSDPTDRRTATTFSDIPTDIIQFTILNRLDGCSLATIRCVSPALRSLSSHKHLWSQICHSTWPSINTPRFNQVISSFPNDGPISFFSLSFPLVDPCNLNPPPSSQQSSPRLLISAVDIYCCNKTIFSKTRETETSTTWFKCYPFRIDLLDPKERVPTGISIPRGHDETCQKFYDDMTLSWIIIDPDRKRAVNLSSIKPVSIQRHWLSGGVQVRFANMLTLAEKAEKVLFRIDVTLGLNGEEKQMYVKDVSLMAEDMDEMHLNGEDSLAILERTLESRRVNRGVKAEVETRRRYDEYLMMRKVRKDIKLKEEWRLDMLCVCFGISVFAAFASFLIFCLQHSVSD